MAPGAGDASLQSGFPFGRIRERSEIELGWKAEEKKGGGSDDFDLNWKTGGTVRASKQDFGGSLGAKKKRAPGRALSFDNTHHNLIGGSSM